MFKESLSDPHVVSKISDFLHNTYGVDFKLAQIEAIDLVKSLREKIKRR